MKNMLSKKFLALVVAMLSVVAVSAQSVKDVIINEVLVQNVDSYEDDYGHRVGWIELKNTGFSQVNVAGCFLDVRKEDGKVIRYKIPKADPRTIIAPQGYVVFLADGAGSKGTFYTNFTLENVKEIDLYDASGRGEPVSAIKIDPSSMKEDISIGYAIQKQGEDAVWGELHSTTPGASNETIEFIPRSDLFAREDPMGIAMAVTAMSVVFLALLALFFVFKRLGIFLVSMANKKELASKGATSPSVKKSEVEMMKDEVNGEVITAIAIAVRQYENDLHDIESEVVTINRVARTYSPWSSKIYGVNNLPAKK